MGGRKKLLNQILTLFTIYTLAVFIISIPVYYYLVDNIWLRELDEHNTIIAERIERKVKELNLKDEELKHSMELWNTIQTGMNVIPVSDSVVGIDSNYTVRRQNPYKDGYHTDRFRGISKSIYINGKPYQLIVETNVEETEETALAIATATLIFILILMIGLLLLNRRLSARIWQPFQSTLLALKTFNLNDGNYIVFEKTNTIEFEELNMILRKLLEHTVSQYRAQREFTENASHELQTPLAIIQNKLDLLLQKEMLSERQYHIIEEIYKALTRISRINKNLLLLAKIENMQYDDFQILNLSIVTIDCVENIREFCEHKRIKISTDIVHEFIIESNRILIEILMNNLFLNAVRHTHENGEVTITLHDDELTVSNSGSSPLEAEKLFRRFGYMPSSNRGNGLGLSIIKAVCDRHHWTIGYSFEHGQHHFSIKVRNSKFLQKHIGVLYKP